MLARRYLSLASVFPFLFLLFFITPESASAAGTLVKTKTTWKGLQRLYSVYIPKGMSANAPMVLFLHSTQDGNPNNPPWVSLPGLWESVADAHKFLLVYPVSTYSTRSGQWYWDCDFFDFSFAVDPDDSGYIRNLITTLTAQYHTDPNQVFVTGMSSGGYMTQRVGFELADIVAAIAPVSGPIWVQPDSQSQTPPLPSRPLSVIEFHGTLDTNVPYCGGGHRTAWKEFGNTVASAQQSMSYWITANACSMVSTTQPICINNRANPSFNGLDATGCLNGVKVKFVPEVGYGHVWVPGTENTIWHFFSTHGR